MLAIKVAIEIYLKERNRDLGKNKEICVQKYLINAQGVEEKV